MLINERGVDFLSRISAKFIYGTIILAAVIVVAAGVFLDSPRRWRWDQRERQRQTETGHQPHRRATVVLDEARQVTRPFVMATRDREPPLHHREERGAWRVPVEHLGRGAGLVEPDRGQVDPAALHVLADVAQDVGELKGGRKVAAALDRFRPKTSSGRGGVDSTNSSRPSTTGGSPSQPWQWA